LANESFSVFCDDTELSTQTGLAILAQDFNCSFAVDKANTDQTLSDPGDWIEIPANNIIWDLSGDYDDETNDFVVPFDGVYYADVQMRIKDILLCSSIELAVFKRDDPDDYWFILDRKILQGETDVQLTATTSFDFYEGERYCLKIKISGALSSCKIDGSDDFTAWGFNFGKSLY
jgi:hypothetical protein